MSQAQITPPPWKLTGSGYIIFYQFSHGYVAGQAFVPAALSGMFVGGRGAALFVDYSESPVGPYQELLFIPGRFAYGSKGIYSITTAYVSSLPAQTNGRANWGIPKEKAEFTVDRDGGVDHWTVAQEGHTFLDVHFKPGHLPFPASTRLFPLPIQQPVDDKIYVTRPRAFGWARLADLTQPKVDAAYFPNLETARPIGTVYLPHFNLTFPAPTIE